MTQEDKDLLLKDLSARLPYGVVVNYKGLARPLFAIELTQHFQITLDNALDGEHNGLAYVSLDVDGEDPKPYLRSMSSMTEEEMEEYKTISIWGEVRKSKVGRTGIAPTVEGYDWLNKNKFDYRGLIDKGLAIEAPEGMYKTK